MEWKDFDKRMKAKIILVIAIFISALMDIYSTFIGGNYHLMESNPIFLGMKWVRNTTIITFILIGSKLFVCGVFSMLLLKDWYFKSSSKYIRYMFVSILVIAVCIQGYAGISNLMVKRQLTERVNIDFGTNYTSFSEVPSSTIEKYMPSDKVKQKQYFNLIALKGIIIPLLFSMLCFIVYNWVVPKDGGL